MSVASKDQSAETAETAKETTRKGISSNLQSQGTDSGDQSTTTEEIMDKTATNGISLTTCSQCPENEVATPESHTSINSLTPEILAMVFHELDAEDKASAAGVCSHWRKVMDIPIVWKDVSIALNLDVLTPEHMEKMQTRKIRNVIISMCSSTDSLTKFLQAMPHLETLDLGNAQFSEQFLPDVFSQDVPRLIRLNFCTSYLSANILESISRRMLNLQSLSIIADTDENILCAVTHLRHLSHLEIDRISSIPVEIAETPVQDTEPMPCLKHLALRNLYLGDTGLGFLARSFPQLDSLEMTLSPDVTVHGLERLSELRELKNLCIRSYVFHNNWMESLKTGLPQLKWLNVSGCAGIDLQCLQWISQMPALEVLGLRLGFFEIEGWMAIRQGCRNLKTLFVTSGDESINQGLHLVSLLPTLENLSLLECSVEDEFWLNYAESFKQLKELGFYACSQLTNQLCLSLPLMSHLEVLYFSKCPGIGDEGLRFLGEAGGLRALKYLMLDELGITDAGLLELPNGLPSLKKLVVVSCPQVTQHGLVSSVFNLPGLQVLEGTFTADTKRRLKLMRPELSIMSIP